jgi:hypothetical protein
MAARPLEGCGNMRMRRMKTCPDCNGDAVVEKGTDDERRCPTCGGSGFVPDDDDSHEEIIKTSPICRVRLNRPRKCGEDVILTTVFPTRDTHI